MAIDETIDKFLLKPAKFPSTDVVDKAMSILFDCRQGFAFLPYNYLSITESSAKVLRDHNIQFEYVTKEEVGQLIGGGEKSKMWNEAYRKYYFEKHGINCEPVRDKEFPRDYIGNL